MAKVAKPDVVSNEEWVAARKALLVEEKAHSRRGDELAAKRRALPWVKLDERYVFEGPKGKVTLEQLFGKASQLVVYHFMFGPDDKEGCAHCSFWADNFDRIGVHLAHRDAAFTAISRAPLAKLQKYQKRMGWSFPWVSSGGTDFNFDLGVSFTDEQLAAGPVTYNYASVDMDDMQDREGISIFAKDKRGVFHTYSCYARGIETVNGAYHFLDLLPKGRDEGGKGPFWVRHHDRYED
jgi:predicted dithiol-disulfide oxidoreductase (DUF899 family)